MISSFKKIPVLRYFLVVLLFTGLILGVLYLYLQYKKAQKIHTDIENLISARGNSALIDSCIINLYSADNNSRLYTITGNKAYLKKFTSDVKKISEVIDKIKFSPDGSTDSNPSKFRALMAEKTLKTGNYIKLRLLTDNLIKYANTISKAPVIVKKTPIKPTVTIEHTLIIDTIKNKDTKPKKKLFGRIIAAFSSKKTVEKNKTITVRKDTVTTSVLPATNNDVFHKTVYKNYYKKLNVVNDKLRNNEQQLLIINNNLIDEIIAGLKHYKSVEQLYIDNSKNELDGSLESAFNQFKQISAISIFILVCLVILVFYNIWKIFRNSQKIVKHSKKTEQHALSKSRFLAGMSHEIRTPLNSVIGFSEQLEQEDLSPVQREQVGAIRSSSEMLLELVNEILDFSKYETGKMAFDLSPFVPVQAIEEIFGSMNIQALKKDILLENEIDISSEVCCYGDKTRLKQVIMNLVGNAIKFTVKGKVTLKAFVEHKDENNLLLKVSIKDTGLGIDKNDLPHIFDEFSQVSAAQKTTRYKGTGLGLPICKKIVELQGGKITVSSEPGQGSVFSFELPLRKCGLKELPKNASMSVELMADLVKGQYVLFAEDNKLNVLLGTTILRKWKIKYDVAHNGHEALLLFEKNNYDLVLTDIQMPELSGLELTELIRNHPDAGKSAIPIMALTANVMKEDKDLYLKAGINDLILKPFLEKKLIEKIALALQNNIDVTRFVS